MNKQKLFTSQEQKKEINLHYSADQLKEQSSLVHHLGDQALDMVMIAGPLKALARSKRHDKIEFGEEC